MESRRKRNAKENGRDKVKKEKSKEKNNEKVQRKEAKEDPLKIFVQIGDCTPQIYNIIIAFNPNIDYSKLNVNEAFFRGLVEDTNKALVPVLKKYVKKLEGK